MSYIIMYLVITYILIVCMWHISVFGQLQDSLENATLLRDFTHHVFLQNFQMAWVTMTVEMDVTLEYDFVIEKVNIVILDNVLPITIIND